LSQESEGNKKLAVLDFIIFGFIGFCLIYAVYLYFHDEYITYNFNETTFNDTEGLIPNFDVSYNLTTTVLSAQNDINISIVAKINDAFKNNYFDEANKIDHINVYLPDTIPKNPQYKDGHVLSYPITLYRSSSDGRFFVGSDVIVYKTEGDKCTFVTTSVLTQSSNCPNNIHPLFHISSPDSYFQYRNNKITLSLTWVLIAFTIVSVRDFLKNMAQNISLLRKKKRDTRDDTKKPSPKK
jgi:hypothetical protein